MGIAKVLLVDDDTELRGLLADQLGRSGEYQVTQVGTGEEALVIARKGGIDLVVLDVGLPDMDGKEVARTLRSEGIGVPILMLTGQGRDDDQVAGLEAGADDYVSKPFRFPVLEARMRSALRQGGARADTRFRLGKYTFVQSDRALTDEAGGKIRLTEKETSILRYLHRLNGGIASKDILLKEVWGYNRAVNTHTVETHVYRLRQKIETDPARPRLLVTQDGGYKLGNAA